MQACPVYFTEQLEPNLLRSHRDLLKEPFAEMIARHQYPLGQSPGHAYSSFLVDDAADSVITAGYPINAAEGAHETPTTCRLVPGATERMTFNDASHHQVVGGASGNEALTADPSFTRNAPAPTVRSINPSRSATIGIGATSEHTAAECELLALKGLTGTLVLNGSPLVRQRPAVFGTVPGFGTQDAVDLPEEVAFDAQSRLAFYRMAIRDGYNTTALTSPVAKVAQPSKHRGEQSPPYIGDWATANAAGRLTAGSGIVGRSGGN